MSETAESVVGIMELDLDDTVRLATGITPDDLAVEHSECGQYLLINCGDALVAMYGAMGGSVAAVQFADGRSYSVEELLDVIAEA